MREILTNKNPPPKSDETAQEATSAFLPVSPFEIIVFGGTGDLARRKLLPALYHRFCDKQFADNVRIISVSRSQMSRDEYLKLIRDSYLEFEKSEQFSEKCWANFCKLVDYVAIDVMDKDDDWSSLRDKLDKTEKLTRVFYLAMPPRLFADICAGLDKAGLAHRGSRVVLEKPIGTRRCRNDPRTRQHFRGWASCCP